jgi:hypothetical protein
MNSKTGHLPDSVERIFDSAKLSVAKLRVAGIESPNIVDELLSAHIAIRSGDYENAYIYAARAKRSADELRTIYQESRTALASADECILDAKSKNADVTGPTNLLRKAKRLFEESDFERACRYANESRALSMRLAGSREASPVSTENDLFGFAEDGCSWLYRSGNGSQALCMNVLGKEFRKTCCGDLDCRTDNPQ